jgi:selenide, water dikinase
VTGTIHPEHVKRNSDARAGDVLVFTKALGTGAIGTALKRGIAQPGWVEAATASMLTLNRAACEAMLRFDVHGCTDVTGFGFLGHAREMAIGSRVTLEIDSSRIPLLPGALEAVHAGAISSGLRNNHDFASAAVEAAGDPNPALIQLLYDPQTSGGLLISLSDVDAEALENALPGAHRVGRVLARDNKPIRIV